MPHECVSCGNVLDDGSDAVLEACPDCGDTTFSYVKEVDDTAPTDEPTTQEYVDSTAENGEGEPEDEDIVEAESSYDRAFGGKLGADAEETGPDTRPEEARRELMDQFETIRIVEPGSYELNLMNLYEEEEKIIALQEDGRYQVSFGSSIDD